MIVFVDVEIELNDDPSEASSVRFELIKAGTQIFGRVRKYLGRIPDFQRLNI